MTRKRGFIFPEPNFNSKRLPSPAARTVTRMDEFTEECGDEGQSSSVGRNIDETSSSGSEQEVVPVQSGVVPSTALSAPPHMAKSLLIQSLVEQLILFHEDDPIKRRRLFRMFCQKLSDLRFIDPVFNTMDFLKPHRARFSMAIQNLFKTIISNSSGNQYTNSALIAMSQSATVDPMDLDMLYSLRGEGDTASLFYTSRYEMDFEEISIIAKGGFGTVWKARKRVDKVDYAVKKIPFSCKNDILLRKVLREVEVFAKLIHRNVVNYKTAWIECKPVMPTTTFSVDDEDNSFDGDFSYEDESQLLVSSSNTSNYSKSIKCAHSDECAAENSKCSNCFQEDEKTEASRKANLLAPVPFRRSHSFKTDFEASTSQICHGFSVPKVRSVLYIQMELCKENLKEWLEDRLTHDPVVNEVTAINIFRQIVKGVSYLHSQGFIHRDLKPLNILFDESQECVKIADFGLSTMCCSSSAMDEVFTPANEIGCSRVAGTTPYAAPEQKARRDYDNKADMYSLGVILLELLNSFGTSMELSKCLEQFTSDEGIIPQDFIDRFSSHAKVIKQLVSRNPTLRPSADELLRSEIFCHKSQVIQRKNEEIAKLRQMLILKDNEMLRLRQQLERLTISDSENPV